MFVPPTFGPILETPNFQDLIDEAQKSSEIIRFGERLRDQIVNRKVNTRKQEEIKGLCK